MIRESRESSDEDIARRYGKEAYRNRRLETESLKVGKSKNINCTWLNIQQEYKYFKHLPWVSMLLKTIFCGSSTDYLMDLQVHTPSATEKNHDIMIPASESLMIVRLMVTSYGSFCRIYG